MLQGAVAGGLVSLSGGLWAAEQAARSGTDWAGIAALITAVSGMVATCGAIYLGSRRRSSTEVTEEALKLLLELQGKKDKDEE